MGLQFCIVTRRTLGAHLVALRKAAGLTQAALAKHVGSQQQVSEWETNTLRPSNQTLVKLAEVLDVPAIELFALVRADLEQELRGLIKERDRLLDERERHLEELAMKTDLHEELGQRMDLFSQIQANQTEAIRLLLQRHGEQGNPALESLPPP